MSIIITNRWVRAPFKIAQLPFFQTTMKWNISKKCIGKTCSKIVYLLSYRVRLKISKSPCNCGSKKAIKLFLMVSYISSSSYWEFYVGLFSVKTEIFQKSVQNCTEQKAPMLSVRLGRKTISNSWWGDSNSATAYFLRREGLLSLIFHCMETF